MTDFTDIKMDSVSYISITSVRVFLITLETVFRAWSHLQKKATQERVDAETLDSFSISTQC